MNCTLCTAAKKGAHSIPDQLNGTFAKVDGNLDFGGQEEIFLQQIRVVVTLSRRRTALLPASVLNHTDMRRYRRARCEIARGRFGKEK